MQSPCSRPSQQQQQQPLLQPPAFLHACRQQRTSAAHEHSSIAACCHPPETRRVVAVSPACTHGSSPSEPAAAAAAVPTAVLVACSSMAPIAPLHGTTAASAWLSWLSSSVVPFQALGCSTAGSACARIQGCCSTSDSRMRDDTSFTSSCSARHCEVTTITPARDVSFVHCTSMSNHVMTITCTAELAGQCITTWNRPNEKRQQGIEQKHATASTASPTLTVYYGQLSSPA
jgi:hypothetical protein